MQYLFIVFTLDRMQVLTKEEATNYIGDGIDIDKFMEFVILMSNILSSGCRKSQQEKAVDSWLENTLSDGAHAQDRKQYFDVSKYIATLKSDETIKECFELYFESLWLTIDRRLNNYVHANGSKYITSNLPHYNYTRREDITIQLISSLKDFMIIFVSLMILIKPNYIQSCDYVDYLDMGETPPEGSQYWISPIIQSFIDTDIVRISPSLKQFLKDNNRYNMQIK